MWAYANVVMIEIGAVLCTKVVAGIVDMRSCLNVLKV